MAFRRVTLWGNSGSGKSTLAEAMGHSLGLPVYHVDLLAWQSGWVYRDETSFLGEQRTWLDQPQWLIEGVGCWPGMLERFHAADLIVFLRTPVELCHARAQQRMDHDRTAKDRFMAEGCRYAAVAEKQRAVIEHFALQLCPAIERTLSEDFSGKAKLTLDGTRSPDQLHRELVSRIGGA